MDQEYSPPPAAPAARQPSLINEVLSIDSMIEQLEHDMRGEVFLETGQFILIDGQNTKIESDGWYRVRKPIMNDIGISDVTKHLRMFVNKFIALSDFDEREIKLAAWEAADGFTELIAAKYNDYDLSVDDMKLLDIQIANLIYSTAKMAINGKLRDAMFKSVSENININQEPKNNSWLPFGWGKR